LALTINGSGFVQTSVARVNGENRQTSFVNANQLTVQLTALDVATAGTAIITVVNPAPGGGTSNAATLNILNPVPVLTSLSPNVVGEDSQGVTLTANGTGFVRGAQILVNGNARVTSFVSVTQLTTQLTAADVANIGTLQIQVANPVPGGGLSNTLPFEIRRRNPVPRLTALNPSSAAAGGPGFTLIVNGTNFVQGSVVRWNGQDRPTDFGSETCWWRRFRPATSWQVALRKSLSLIPRQVAARPAPCRSRSSTRPRASPALAPIRTVAGGAW
jgi:hypothetical protein